MNNSYQPRPQIARYKSFDSGVDSLHLIWSMGSKPRLGMRTEPIKLGPIKFERAPIGFGTPADAELNMRLAFDVDHYGEGPYIWFNNIGGDVENSPDVLFMARIEIRNDDNPRFKTLSSPPKLVTSFCSGGNCQTPGCDLTEEEAKTIKGPGEFVVHCWIDIPKKIDASPMRDCSLDSFPKYGPGLLASNIAGLWKEVIGRREETAPVLSDVLLMVKNDKEERGFNCHRIVLATRSPVFAQLLANCNVVNNRFTIELDGAEFEVIGYALKHIYLGFPAPNFGRFGESQVPEALIEKVAEAADKFRLPELKDECWHHMIPHYIESIDQWFGLLRSAEKLKMEHLKKICLVALSSDPRLFDDQKMRDQISPDSMAEVMEMVKMREENTKVIEMKMPMMEMEMGSNSDEDE